MDLCPPPKQEVYEMLWCTNQCGNLSGPSSSSDTSSSSSSSPDVTSGPYLCFDEYSVFAAEMKRAFPTEKEVQTSAPAPKIPHKTEEQTLPSVSDFISQCNANKSCTQCQVFLGGACNPTTWRKDIAVPLLKDLGITFFNPQVTNWEPALIELEHQARETADVLFYVIDNQTRCVVVMIEVAYFVAKHRNVVLVINGFKEPGQQICNEPISQIEYEDLTHSQLILQELVEQHSIPVFNDITTALNCTAKIIKENLRPQDLKLKELEQPIKNGVLQIGNKLINLRKTFENLDSKRKGEISLPHVRMAYRILTNGELTKDAVSRVLESFKQKEAELVKSSPSNDTSSKKEANGVNGIALNFEQFCCIMSELILNHYRNSARNISNLFANKASHLFQSVSFALTKLLEHVPGNKPGWMPGLSKQESEEESVSHSFYHVYLGGDSSETWRSDVIPVLRDNGITFFDPSSEINCKDQGVEAEKAVIDKCKVILFYVPSSTRSIESMTMAAYWFGRGYQVVLCIGYLQDECQIKDEKLSKVAVKDYNRGRSYLTDMAKREGIPIFENIQDALECVVDKCSGLNLN